MDWAWNWICGTYDIIIESEGKDTLKPICYMRTLVKTTINVFTLMLQFTIAISFFSNPFNHTFEKRIACTWYLTNNDLSHLKTAFSASLLMQISLIRCH